MTRIAEEAPVKRIARREKGRQDLVAQTRVRGDQSPECARGTKSTSPASATRAVQLPEGLIALSRQRSLIHSSKK
jgi:hypothetical protein